MPDSRRFLHPESIKRISRLELRARHIVEGFLSGMHRSPYFGQSVEFLQHREYVPGDDLRHVDWKVWARQDRLYVKQFEEDTNLRCTLLVDVSNSMEYGSGPLNKYEYACTLAASLAYLVLKQNDAVGCISFDEQHSDAGPDPQQTQPSAIGNRIAGHQPAARQDRTCMPIFRSVAESVAPARHDGRSFPIYWPILSGTIRGLRLLRQRGHDVLVFHVMDDDELDFPFSGPTRFEGLESIDYLNCNPTRLARRVPGSG